MYTFHVPQEEVLFYRNYSFSPKYDVTLHISNDGFNEITDREIDHEHFASMTMESFMLNLREHSYSFLDYLELYSWLTGLKGYGILTAHGESVNGRWIYYDDGITRNVQGWITENDGKYLAILLNICNPSSAEIRSEKSIVIVPNGVYSEFEADFGNFNIEFYVPRTGYVDGYTIGDELRQLREKGIV